MTSSLHDRLTEEDIAWFDDAMIRLHGVDDKIIYWRWLAIQRAAREAVTAREKLENPENWTGEDCDFPTMAPAPQSEVSGEREKQEVRFHPAQEKCAALVVKLRKEGDNETADALTRLLEMADRPSPSVHADKPTAGDEELVETPERIAKNLDRIAGELNVRGGRSVNESYWLRDARRLLTRQQEEIASLKAEVDEATKWRDHWWEKYVAYSDKMDEHVKSLRATLAEKEAEIERLRKPLEDIVGGITAGHVKVASPDVHHPDAGSAEFWPWHEEWLHHARAALAQRKEGT